MASHNDANPIVEASMPPAENASTNSRGPMVLNEMNALEHTAYSFSTKKKWWILTVFALYQTSMNFNAALYSNAIGPLNAHFNLGDNHITNARAGMA